MPKFNITAKDILGKACSHLILRSPFYSSLLLATDLEENKNIPTAATNGMKIWYNPDYIENLSQKDNRSSYMTEVTEKAKTLLCHEVLHIAMMHMFRRGGRDPLVWNIATDAWINNTLVDEKFTALDGWVDIPGSKDKTSEEIYDELMKNAKQIKIMSKSSLLGDLKDPGDGDNPDDSGSGKESPEEAAAREMKVSIKVQKAIDVAKACGALPGSLERMISSALDGKLPWKQLLREAVTTITSKDDYTWARANRRYVGAGLYLPGMEGIQCGPIVLAFDTSGSIGERELSAFLGEMNSIFEEVSPQSIRLIACDAEVAHAEEIDMESLPLTTDQFSSKMKGGGGTAFSPVFEYLKNNSIHAEMVIYFTDLCCSDFGTPPECPVLWVTTHNGEAPFGQVIKMDI